MNEKLNPEVRQKVAGECVPDMDWRIWKWNPSQQLRHKDALTRTAARLAIKTGNAAVYWKALQYIEANDTDALERIVAELMGFV